MKELDGPADTRVMGIVHSALRRDLRRARIVLEGDPTEGRRTALAAHLAWLMDFLHHHHEGEDAGLYPLVVRRDPSAASLVAAMDAEHAAIHPAMEGLLAAAAAYPDAGDPAPVLEALDALEEALLPHLEREEREMMPLVSRAITERDWQAWDDEHNIKPKSALQLAMEGHWLIDHADDVSRNAIVELVPPVPRFVILHFLGGPYRRRCKALWSGTAAAALPPVVVTAP